MFEIVPLSPLRECAIAPELHVTRPRRRTVHGTSARGMNVDAIATTSRTDRVAPPPPAGPFVYSASTSSPIRCAASRDDARAATRTRTSYGSDRRSGDRVAVQGAHADQIAADDRHGEIPELLQPVAGHGRREPGAPHGAAAGIRDLPFADVAVAISERHLQRVRPRHGRSRRRPPRGRVRPR